MHHGEPLGFSPRARVFLAGPLISDMNRLATFSVPLAALVVFWSILQDPSRASARDDAQLLLPASGYLAACHGTLGLPAPVLQHFRSMSHFVGEFYRLTIAATSVSALVPNQRR